MRCKNPKIFACGGLGALGSLVHCRPYVKIHAIKIRDIKIRAILKEKKRMRIKKYIFNHYDIPCWVEGTFRAG